MMSTPKGLKAPYPFPSSYAAAACVAATHQPPPAPRFLFKVTVRLEGGQVESFEGVYAHTFDAYDSAFAQFPSCERVEAKSLGMRPLRHHADGGAS